LQVIDTTLYRNIAHIGASVDVFQTAQQQVNGIFQATQTMLSEWHGMYTPCMP
jgi:hypothetical protein